MPVYNGGIHLGEAIESILNQTFSDFELIIINDGSTDNSEQIILAFNDSRIKYIKNSANLRLIKTLNIGLDLAKGEFIARMDQDDIANPQRFSKQVSLLENNPEIGVCGTWFTVFGNGIEKILISHPENHDSIKIHLLGYCTIGHPTVMLRKSMLASQRYDDNYQAAEDYEFWVRLSINTKMYNIPESLLDYRMHTTNMTVLEDSTQTKTSDKIRREQLRRLNIEKTENEIVYCELLFTPKYVESISESELKKIIEFANKLERANEKKRIYENGILHLTFYKRLYYMFDKLETKSLFLVGYILLNRRELLRKRGIRFTLNLIMKTIASK
ncbi:hypothetical protein ASG31_14680 [Chryseobacterium sp. Leaf404]|nr:hypothetical protein ASG31_14680 [Chryseobacterium sp. Leaf404]